ncbi:MAG: hypothetical protein ACLU0O_02940 [Collinsella sp.]
MNKEELKKLLPHREPMLLLDEAELVGDEAHGKITITGDEYFCRAFSGKPGRPRRDPVRDARPELLRAADGR